MISIRRTGDGFHPGLFTFFIHTHSPLSAIEQYSIWKPYSKNWVFDNPIAFYMLFIEKEMHHKALFIAPQYTSSSIKPIIYFLNFLLNPNFLNPFLNAFFWNSWFKSLSFLPLYRLCTKGMKITCTGANPAAMRSAERHYCFPGKIIAF